MNGSLVSIIVTCYNQEHFILNTLNSVKRQTYKNWDCVIVDDGSTDASANVIKNFINGDSRFKYVFQKNKGVSQARNLGFELSKGSFIQLLDGDDTLLPDKLFDQINIFQDNPDVFICICDHQHYYEEENKYQYFNFEPIKEKPLNQILYKWEDGVAFPPHAALYRKELWKNGKEFFPKDYNERSEDWVFNILVALQNKKYYFHNKILCNYHMTGKNFTASALDGAIATIHAAFYINRFLPKTYKRGFIDHTIKKTLKRYVELEKTTIYRSSGNWRLGNMLSKPFFKILKIIKRKV